MPACQSELKLGTPVYDFELYVLCRVCLWWEWDQSRKGKEERGEEKKLLFVKTKERSVGAVNLDLSRSFPFPLFRGTRIAIQRVSRLARSLSHPRCTFLVWPRKRAKRPIKRSSLNSYLSFSPRPPVFNDQACARGEGPKFVDGTRSPTAATDLSTAAVEYMESVQLALNSTS